MSAHRSPSRRPARALLALCGLIVVAACGGGSDALSAASGSPSPSAAATPSASVSIGGPASSAPEDDPSDAPTASPTPFAGDVGVSESGSGGGGPLSVTAVRIGHQVGFDRVVIELAAAGASPAEPGWRTEYTDTPTRDGSGEAVTIEGASALTLSVTGVGYPLDTGVTEYAGPARVSGSGTEVVTEVFMGSVFEGHYDVVIGVQERRPYRVFRLADPARVVIDIATR